MEFKRWLESEESLSLSWWPDRGWVDHHLGDRPPIQAYSIKAKGQYRISVEPSPNHLLMKRAIKQLVRQHPDVVNAIIEFDGWSPGTVADYLKSSKFQGRKDHLPRYLYHGTSLYRWENIRDEGLKPRIETGAEPVFGSRYQAPPGPDEHVYFAGNYNSAARMAADEAARDGSHPIVLQINTEGLRYTLLRPDHDAKTHDWQISLQTTNTVAYEGTVYPKYIEVYKAWNPETKQWEGPGRWLEPKDWLAQQFLHWQDKDAKEIPGVGKYKWVSPKDWP